MTNDIRVALIGYGLGGRVFHAPFIATTPGLRLTTVVTSNPERGEQALQDFPSVRVASSADDVWAQAGEHDLVVITTANRAHVPLARAAIAAGQAVIIDKPFAASSIDARALLSEARNAGARITVYHERRWDGDFLTARRLIAEGALGSVLRFESRLERWRPQPNTAAWRERAEPEDAGGVLFDLGSHLIDQALVLFGPVTHVYAELARRRPGVLVEDDVFLALRHASGVLSHLWASAAAAHSGPRLRVLGTQAAFVKEHVDVQEEALRAGVLPNTEGFGEDFVEHWGVLGTPGDTRPVKTERGDYSRFYAQTVEWLRDGAPPPVAPEDAVVGLEIIEAVKRSAAAQQVVELQSAA